MRDHLGAGAEELPKHRFGVVNVWRPIRGPVQDSPLALCDARSLTDDDLIASDLVYAHVWATWSAWPSPPAESWSKRAASGTVDDLYFASCLAMTGCP